MSYYFAGMCVGVIVLQASIIAPSLAKTLSREDFGVSIRVIWPKFFLVVLVTGLACFAGLLGAEQLDIGKLVIASLTVVFALVCFFIIPATNRATDTGNHQVFQRLHLISVVLTVSVLFGNILFLFM